MRKTWLFRITLLILILAGIIPLFIAIIPAKRRLRSMDLPHLIQTAHGQFDLPSMSVQLDEPVYYRAGIVENIRLNLTCEDCLQGKPLSLLVHLQMPFTSLDPSGQVIMNVPSAISQAIVWDAIAANKQPIEGTLWVFTGLESENIALLAVPLNVTSLSFLGQPVDLAALFGCLFSFFCVLIWLFTESRKKATVSGKPPENAPVL